MAGRVAQEPRRPQCAGKDGPGEYRGIVQRHLAPYFGGLKLRQLTPAHIQAYHTHSLTCGRKDCPGGLNPRTVGHHHRLLSTALSRAVKLSVITRNPALAIRPPRPNPRDIRVLDAEGVRQLIDKAERSTEYGPLIALTAYSGLRRSELLGLQWKDIDLLGGTVNAERALHILNDGTVIIEAPKSKASQRTVALTPAAVITLKRHRERQTAERLLLGRVLTDSTRVSERPDGSMLRPNSLSHLVAKLARKLGYEGIGIHSLRHSFATLMLQDDIHPKIVSTILGHSSISLTLDTYSHPGIDLQRAAAQRLGEVLSGDLPSPKSEGLPSIRHQTAS